MRNVATGIVLSLLLCNYLCSLFACFLTACFWRNKDAYESFISCHFLIELTSKAVALVCLWSQVESHKWTALASLLLVVV